MGPLQKAIASCSKAKISEKDIEKIVKAANEYSESEPTVIKLDLIRPIIVGNGKKFLLLNHLKDGDKLINPYADEKILIFGIDLDSYELKAVAITRKELCSTESWSSIIQEIKMMKKCEGVEGIIQMDLSFTLQNSIYIVLDYYNAGQLGELLIALVVVDLNQTLIVKLALDIATGLHNLHDLGILHRDIKPQNIFVYENNKKTPHAVLADLGSAAEINDSEEIKKFTGSYAWFSPETAKLIATLENEEKLTPYWIKTMTGKADVWALGCVFFLLFKGGVLSWQRVPEGEGRNRQVAKNVTQLNDKEVAQEIQNSNLDSKLKPLITGMLRVNPEKRWNALQVFEFLSKLSREGL